MAGGGKRGKLSAGFRFLPTALGNRKKARFPHSHRLDDDIVVSNFKLQEANPALPHAPHPFEIPSLPTPPGTECPHCARPSLPTPNSEAVCIKLDLVPTHSSSLWDICLAARPAISSGGLWRPFFSTATSWSGAIAAMSVGQSADGPNRWLVVISIESYSQAIRIPLRLKVDPIVKTVFDFQ